MATRLACFAGFLGLLAGLLALLSCRLAFLLACLLVALLVCCFFCVCLFRWFPWLVDVCVDWCFKLTSFHRMLMQLDGIVQQCSWHFDGKSTSPWPSHLGFPMFSSRGLPRMCRCALLPSLDGVEEKLKGNHGGSTNAFGDTGAGTLGGVRL